jgi:hypothetical protein
VLAGLSAFRGLRYIGLMAKGWTYQKLIDGEMTVTAYCHDCNHSKKLDLAKLRDRFGPDALAMADDIIPRLKCEKCGSKKVGTIYAPDVEKVPGMGKVSALGKSLYEKAKGQ